MSFLVWFSSCYGSQSWLLFFDCVLGVIWLCGFHVSILVSQNNTERPYTLGLPLVGKIYTLGINVIDGFCCRTLGSILN